MYMRLYKKRRDVFKKISEVEKTPSPKKDDDIKEPTDGYDAVNIQDLFDDRNTDIYYEELI